MMSSKKYTMKPAKKKAPMEDDSDILESTPQKMPAAASSTSRAKSNFKLSSFPAASKNYTIQPQDAGVTFSYTENGEHKVEVDIHVNGVVTRDSFETEVSDDRMALKWRRATPPTFFDENVGKENDALRRNGTKAVALQNAVRKMKSELGLKKGTSEYFGEEWQYFKLDIECCPKVSKVIVGKSKGIEINGNVQFNSVIRIILLAKEQYEEDCYDVVEEVFFGSGGGGGGGKYNPSSSSDDDDSDNDKKPAAKPELKHGSKNKSGGSSVWSSSCSKKRAEQCEPAATAPAKKESRTSTAFKSEYAFSNQNCRADIPMVEIVDDSSDDNDSY